PKRATLNLWLFRIDPPLSAGCGHPSGVARTVEHCLLRWVVPEHAHEGSGRVIEPSEFAPPYPLVGFYRTDGHDVDSEASKLREPCLSRPHCPRHVEHAPTEVRAVEEVFLLALQVPDGLIGADPSRKEGEDRAVPPGPRRGVRTAQPKGATAEHDAC